MATAKQKAQAQVDRKSAGLASGPCGKASCDEDVYFKPNRLGSDGVYYHVGHEPKGVSFKVEGTIAKTETTAAWAKTGIGPVARKAKREQAKAKRESANKAKAKKGAAASGTKSKATSPAKKAASSKKSSGKAAA